MGGMRPRLLTFSRSIMDRVVTQAALGRVPELASSCAHAGGKGASGCELGSDRVLEIQMGRIVFDAVSQLQITPQTVSHLPVLRFASLSCTVQSKCWNHEEHQHRRNPRAPTAKFGSFCEAHGANVAVESTRTNL